MPGGAPPEGPEGLPKRIRPAPVYSDLLVPASGSPEPADGRQPAFPAAPPRPTATIEPDGGTPSIPQPRGPEQTELRVEPIAPSDTGPDSTPETGKGGPPVSVIVGAVILGASLLVLAALGMPYLLQQLRTPASPSYAVGDCVVQDAGQARVVPCTHPGAYEITSQVVDRDECPDPTNPTVAAGSDVFCLEPTGAGAGAESDADPDAEE